VEAAAACCAEDVAVKPRICFVNTHDTIGGAERCSFDLMTGLRARGREVSLVVGRKFSDDPDVHQCVYPQWDWRPRAFLNHRVGLTDTTLVTPLRLLASPVFRSANVVNIHNMHGCYWNFWTVPLEASRKPVVLTLHDEWFLTGDCAYTYQCERWLHHCGKCPQFAWTIRPALGGRDFTPVNLWLKRAAARLTSSRRLTIVTPSQWLARQVRRAPHLSRFEQLTIPNGIDTHLFRPRDKSAARAKFGVPRDKFCFLFFAHNLDDPRKGGQCLERTLSESGLPENSMLLLAGKGGEAIAAKFPSLPIQLLGYLDSREDVAACLSAADCVLLLSAADNLPYGGIEAIACGCLVLARDVGGIGEIVEPGRSGILLDADVTAGQLAAEMSRIAQLPASERRRLSGAARDLAVERFSMDLFLHRYEALFQERHEKHLKDSSSHYRGGA
jgi:glycosyltransferase involved in cell wall biosynthesis